METYLRFTTTGYEDLERGTSLLSLPSLDEDEVLEGLCAFSFDIDHDMTEDDILRKVEMYAKNFCYYNEGTAVIIEGEYIKQNPNGEGVVIRAERIIKEYNDL